MLNNCTQIVATITPLTVRYHREFRFETYKANGTYHWRVFNNLGFIYDSGGDTPNGYASIMTATNAAKQWLDVRRKDGRII